MEGWKSCEKDEDNEAGGGPLCIPLSNTGRIPNPPNDNPADNGVE